MKMYFAGPHTSIELMRKHKCKVLSTYIECINTEQMAKIIGLNTDFFLDCGAFSVYTGKLGSIDIEKYIKFIVAHESKLNVYAALDVIGDPVATYQNYEIMTKEGLNPIPAYHCGSDIKWLKKYIEQTNYIAIGGMAGRLKRRKNVLKKFLARIFALTKQQIRLHGFGLTGALLEEFPFYSCDSTGWISAGKQRTVAIFDGSKMRGQTTIKRDPNKGSHALTTLGYKRLFDIAIGSHKRYEQYITDLWAKRGVVWDEEKSV